eukprot:12420312-Alexandrium_andersonii.AAC.1
MDLPSDVPTGRPLWGALPPIGSAPLGIPGASQQGACAAELGDLAPVPTRGPIRAAVRRAKCIATA